MRQLTGLLALLLVAGTAQAVDGVLEINQACALTTGCFTGDAPGFPVEITGAAPGRSFRLTGDLSNGSLVTGTIAISIGPITLDLGGFFLRGPSSCALGPMGVACVNTGAGVSIEGGAASGVVLRNGHVTGAPGVSILLGTLAVVTDVNVVSAGSDGIAVGGGSRVSRCTVADVLGYGLRADQSSVFDTVIYEPRLGGVLNPNATYLTAIRNLQVTRWGIPVFVPPFTNTVSVGPNLCNGVAC